MLKAKISALGCYAPPQVLTNQDLEKLVETNDQWIMDRTGIRERHIAAPEIATSDMAIEAARRFENPMILALIMTDIVKAGNIGAMEAGFLHCVARAARAGSMN